MANSPTWYELLGVANDATAEEIKAAWRHATDKFEPGSGTGQFRLFNEAADVLLDADKRAAYDAELAPAAVESPAQPQIPEPAVPAVDTIAPPAPPAAADLATPPTGTEATRGLAGSTLALIITLVVCIPLLLASLAVMIGSLWGLHAGAVTIDSVSARSDASTWEAGKEASAAAERALNSVLSYDYRHMEADRVRAVGFLTPAYAKTFSKTFSLLTTGPNGSVGPAVKTETVVTANVLDTGVVEADRSKVDVIAFVNQTSVKPGKTPAIFQNRVVVTMVRSGDRWLISNVKTY